MFKLSNFARVLLLGLGPVFAVTPAPAQNYPDRAIRLIVPFPPGGSVDIAARTLGPILSQKFGEPLVIENRPGAAGQVGVAEAVRSPHDGYTFVFSTPGATAINMHLRPLGYNPLKDLVPISLIATVPTAIATKSGIPAETVQQFLAFGKTQSGLNFSHPGVGSQNHLALELFKFRTGLNIQSVPFNGTQPATAAILAGQVDGGVSDLSTLLPLAASQGLRILAVVDLTRAQSAPQIPTVAESGFPGFSASGWIALFAAAGTPQAILERWNAELVAALKIPDVQKVFLGAGLQAASTSLSDARKFHQDEVTKWGDIIKAANITLQ